MRAAARSTRVGQRLIDKALRTIDRCGGTIPRRISTTFTRDTLLVLLTAGPLPARRGRWAYVTTRFAWARPRLR